MRVRSRDGKSVLEGAALSRMADMLIHIFHFERVAEARGKAPYWLSSFVLTTEERSYMEKVIKRRLDALFKGEDQLVPFPPGEQERNVARKYCIKSVTYFLFNIPCFLYKRSTMPFYYQIYILSYFNCI